MASVRSTWSTCPGPTASARGRKTNRSPSTPCSGEPASAPTPCSIVADATALGRALYLAGEIIDTGARAVIALNMVDEARSQRLAIDEARLATDLGVPVVATVARAGQGLDRPAPDTRRRVAHSACVAGSRDAAAASRAGRRGTGRRGPPRNAGAWRRHACVGHVGAPVDRRRAAGRTGRCAARPSARRARAATAASGDGRNLDLEIIGARYERVDRMVGHAVRPPALPPPRWTDRIDSVLTHRVARRRRVRAW